MLKKLRRLAVKAAERAQMALASLVALGRRRASYVIENRPGLDNTPLTGKVCVFAHCDRRGEVHDYVLHHLKCLRHAGFRLVVVSNAADPRPEAIAALTAIAQRVLIRRDVGGYFGAYKEGIAAIDDLAAVDLLLLANDTLYGPFTALDTVIARMSAQRGQFWSLTDNWQRAYHLDTDFMLFGRDALANPAFARFWRGVRYVNSPYYEFRRYAVGLSQALLRAGLRGGVLCSHRDMARVIIDAVRGGALDGENLDDRQLHLKDVYELVQLGRPIDLSAYLWDYLIVRMGYPFIKRELFQRDRVQAPYIAHWQGVLAQESDYDPDLIIQHLEATLRNRFT